MKRTQLYLPEKTYSELSAKAKAEKKSVSALVREALDEYRNLEAFTGVREPLGTRLAKIKANGPKDLSVNLEKYLYDK